MATERYADRSGREIGHDPGAELRLRLPAKPSNVGLARHLVGDLLRELGYERGRVLDIQLALTEALANTAFHAYSDAIQPGVFDLLVRADAGHVHIDVEDEGSGVPTSGRGGAGLGIPLMRALADAVHVEHRAGAGTRVTLGFGGGRH
jgi:anti-sigma regulatory factor (Ser/Thr protein kinase)